MKHSYNTVPVKNYLVNRYSETKTGKPAYSAFRIKQLNTWIKQNHGECIDCCEGSLLDNMIIACKRGTAFIFEQYLNSNSSTYACYFVPDKASNDILNSFYDEFEHLRTDEEEA